MSDTPFAIRCGKEIATMPRYKPQEHNSLLLPVVLPEQIIPGVTATNSATMKTAQRQQAQGWQKLRHTLGVTEKFLIIDPQSFHRPAVASGKRVFLQSR